MKETSGKVVTDAISTYLYPDIIPDDRHTEFKQEFSSTGSWAVQVNEHDLHAGEYFISVRCGAMPVAFKVVPFLVKSKLEDHEHIHAEVCSTSPCVNMFFYMLHLDVLDDRDCLVRYVLVGGPITISMFKRRRTHCKQRTIGHQGTR